jgi:hypothetical protein
MGNNPMKTDPMFSRLEELSRTFNQLRNMVLDQVENEDTAADLCDVIDYCITKMDRCVTSMREGGRS